MVGTDESQWGYPAQGFWRNRRTEAVWDGTKALPLESVIEDQWLFSDEIAAYLGIKGARSTNGYMKTKCPFTVWTASGNPARKRWTSGLGQGYPAIKSPDEKEMANG